MPIMNTRTRVEDAPCTANGPRPKIVPQTAKPKRMSDAVAVSRGPRRNAAHISGSTAKTANGGVGMSAANGLKAIAPNTPAVAKIAIDSRSGRRSNDRGWSVTHRTRTGVISSSAAKSLSQPESQMAANFSHSIVFDATRDSETEFDARRRHLR